MATWVKAQTPTICERAIGFSVPAADEFVVISYEGLHRVRVGDTIAVKTDEQLAEYAAYDPAAGVAHYAGRDYNIVGLHGGKPLVTTERGESLRLDTSSETLSIFQGDVEVFTMRYKNFSGDWAVATFSREGDRLVLGCPYGFDFVILERAG
jgi:hypothetical protein